MIRGIRGATTVEQNSADAILSATEELILAMAEQNRVKPDDMVSMIFTLTNDLNAAFPAEAARRVGWKYVPVMCMREIDVPGSLAKTVRVLMQAEVDCRPEAVRHVYLREALQLRSDLTPSGGGGTTHER